LFVDLTCVEESVIAKHHVKALIFNITTKNYFAQTKIRGNVITYPQNPETILNKLPSMPQIELFQVAFVGKSRPNPLTVKQIFRVRKAKINNALECLSEINVKYTNVEKCENSLNALPEDDIPKEIEDNFIYVDQEDKNNTKVGYDNINRENDPNETTLDETITFSHSLLSNTAESLSHDLVEQIDLLKKSYQKSNTSIDTSWSLNVQHDNQPVSEINNPDHLINAYPTLFPYGIGGIGDSRRKIKLSYREHTNYLLRLNCNRFRTHRSFLFVVNINKINYMLLIIPLFHS